MITNDPTVHMEPSDRGAGGGPGRGRGRGVQPRRSRQGKKGLRDVPARSSASSGIGGDPPDSVHDEKADSWTSAKGPQPGVRWRGGSAPTPPPWKPTSSDPQAFKRWEKKARIWQIMVKNYMTDKEAGLARRAGRAAEDDPGGHRPGPHLQQDQERPPAAVPGAQAASTAGWLLQQGRWEGLCQPEPQGLPSSWLFSAQGVFKGAQGRWQEVRLRHRPDGDRDGGQ